MISVKAFPREELDKVISKDIHTMKGWQWKGVDQARIDNVDSKGLPSKNYCVDCYYLVHL